MAGQQCALAAHSTGLLAAQACSTQHQLVVWAAQAHGTMLACWALRRLRGRIRVRCSPCLCLYVRQVRVNSEAMPLLAVCPGDAFVSTASCTRMQPSGVALMVGKADATIQSAARIF